MGAKDFTREEDEQHLRMLAMLDAGKTFDQVAKAVGVSRGSALGTVKRIRDAYDLSEGLPPQALAAGRLRPGPRRR